MMAIAILSLIGWFIGILLSIAQTQDSNTFTESRFIIASICVYSWWSISFPVAILVLIGSSILGILFLASNYKK